MRADTHLCRRIAGAYLREEEQHEQRAPAGAQIDAHFAMGPRKAGFNMPPGIQRRIRARKAERKGSETGQCDPAPSADKLIERLVERRRVCGRSERGCAEALKANERLSPSRSVEWVTPNGVPELPST